jgi:hypothetical protein
VPEVTLKVKPLLMLLLITVSTARPDQAAFTDEDFAPVAVKIGLYWENRMFDEAVRFTKAAVEANVFDPRLHLVYAEALRRAGEAAKALNQYEIVVKLDPRFWRAQDCLAHGYLWASGSTGKTAIVQPRCAFLGS